MKIDNLNAHGFTVSDSYEPELSGRSENLLNKWQSSVRSVADNFSAQPIDVPACIAKSILDKAEYTANFPQHVMECQNGSEQEASDQLATPATCLYMYSDQAGSQISDTAVTYFGQTTCRRKEAKEWSLPFVLQSFTMAEIVVLGAREEVQEARQSFRLAAEEIFYNRNIPVEVTPATDAFFLGENSGAKYMQKIKELKHEFVAEVGQESVPVASVNLHEDYFGRHFNIADENGNPCWSACLAFGLERAVVCDLLQNE